MDERKRDSMIAYLRHRMEEHGIEPDDLASAIAGDQVRQKAARYQNATGDTWTGDGEMPQWLKQAISSGQRLEHFEMASASPMQDTQRKRIDWRGDPFAGSPLARQHAD
ncbi:histone family protein nucleoid-structuring protein H-NS [Paraburkholderia hospita]|uniref:Histone family protein nucleoid-structuring protein H-NS n=1 Tax=Paraburkholderia hospita TaxID=169430 RepID=A0AAN1JM57_9BURK|nr:H-NS histone family protein [Paraburkholderia hospita]AUT75858.1 histone family protein nucleoid-structuring protein H-NS [Paraburkholderia hospita]